MYYIPAIFSLVVAAAGWYYLFYSRAASNLSAMESRQPNRRRVRLRRLGGVLMILMGLGFAIGFYSFDRESPAGPFFLVWTAVLVLMLLIMILALIDLRLTWKLRRQPPRGGRSHAQNRDETGQTRDP